MMPFWMSEYKKRAMQSQETPEFDPQVEPEMYGPFLPPAASMLPKDSMPPGHVDMNTLSPEAKRILEGVPESKTPNAAEETHARINSAKKEDPRVEQRMNEYKQEEKVYLGQQAASRKAMSDRVQKRMDERDEIEKDPLGLGRYPGLPKSLEDIQLKRRMLERQQEKRKMRY